MESVRYTAGYIRAFDAAAAQAKDSAADRGHEGEYPQAGEPASLELSAKVAKGEKW